MESEPTIQARAKARDAALRRLNRLAAGVAAGALRSWNPGGQMLHHIIDPSSGLPANGQWRTATVAAGTCVYANIAATAAILLGKLAVSWLEMRNLPARLVDRKGNVARLAGWLEAEPPTMFF